MTINGHTNIISVADLVKTGLGDFRMKKIILIILAISVMIFAGCATSSTEREEPEVQEKAASVEEKAAPEKTAVTRIVNIPYLLKDTDYFSDGYIESYRVYSYNDDMSLAREDLFDSFDELIESRVCEKINDDSVKESLFNTRGQLQSWQKIVSGVDGQVLRVESYNAEDVIQTVSEYEYDDYGNKTVWKVLNEGGVVLSETRYIYEGGLNTIIEIYDSSMKLYEYFENTYADGLLIKNSHFGENQKLMDAVEYEYDGSILTGEKYLRANGSTSRMVKYTNDEQGSPVKTEFFNGNGDLKDWNEKEFEYVSEEITVWE